MVLQTEILLLLLTQSSLAVKVATRSALEIIKIYRDWDLKALMGDLLGRAENLCTQRLGRGLAPAATGEAAIAKYTFPCLVWALRCHTAHFQEDLPE